MATSEASEAGPGWSAVCAGRLAETATEAVLAIAGELRSLRVADPSLTGQGGFAVLYSYLAQAFPDHGFAEVAEDHLAAAVSALAATPMRPGLFGGFTGLAWCVEHIAPVAAGAPPDDDPGAEIDDALAGALARSPWPADYDLISGLTGFAVYALDRVQRVSGLRCASLILDRLAELARPQPTGLTWWSDPRLLPPGIRADPAGAFNLGVAHGVPGAIGALARACRVPSLADRARPLLDGAVAWLLAQRLPDGAGGRFGYQAGDTAPARTAWCYGDLGIAAVLLTAAREVDDAALEQAALEIALVTLDRPFERTGVHDAALCHGAVGIAHLYNRIYQATGTAALGDAARWWYARTVELRTPGVGIAGFVAQATGERGQDTWTADPAFLTGACGIALGLLAAVAPIAPDWDRVLLCSVAPGAARPSRARPVPAGW